MDIPRISDSALKTLGITQPVIVSRPITPIAAEAHTSGNRTGNYGKKGKAPRGEEWVDISDLSRLLAKGIRGR
jgi:hypothetical protein